MFEDVKFFTNTIHQLCQKSILLVFPIPTSKWNQFRPATQINKCYAKEKMGLINFTFQRRRKGKQVCRENHMVICLNAELTIIIIKTMKFLGFMDFIWSVRSVYVGLKFCITTYHTFILHFQQRQRVNRPGKRLPFADSAPPVTHPATTVFVVSCLARAWNNNAELAPIAKISNLINHIKIKRMNFNIFGNTFSTTHSAAEKTNPITANALAELQLLRPICFAWYMNCCLPVISSCIRGVSNAPRSKPIINPSPPPTEFQQHSKN